MTTETRDPEFARFINDFYGSVSMEDIALSRGVLEPIALTVLALYDAIATSLTHRQRVHQDNGRTSGPERVKKTYDPPSFFG
jgi:hypothetical protein